ncbi:8589_t:CDS:2, partial [Cetraspora pellucida]
TVPENTQKATAKWVKILENWQHDARYKYKIKTVTNKNQLEQKKTKFILKIQQVNKNKEYVLSSLINCIKLLKTLNGKIKKLKKEGLVSHHYNHLTDTELQTIFQHYIIANNTPQEQFEFSSNSGIHFKKYSQKNNQDGINGNSDALIIPVLSDPKDVTINTTMFITGHKSESSYRIYAHPSNKQKEDALSLLIDSIETLSSDSQESEALAKI